MRETTKIPGEHIRDINMKKANTNQTNPELLNEEN
jgi:hypothetical protein